MCKKKDTIIEALKASGMKEHEAIATEIEIGRISLVGCTTYRDEANTRLMRIVSEKAYTNPEEVRALARRMSDVLRIEKNAQRASQSVAQRFYAQLHRV